MNGIKITLSTDRNSGISYPYIWIERKDTPKKGGGTMAKKEIKELTIIINGTDRKRKEIERVVRQALNDYQNRKGVYDLEIVEVNKKVLL